jgi:hypothetical protein
MRTAPGVDIERVDRVLRDTQFLYVDLPGRDDPRRDYGAVVDWWWATEGRVVMALDGGVLSVTRPRCTDRPGLTFRDCERVALIGLQHGPGMGGVEVGRDLTVTLDRHVARPRGERRGVPAAGSAEPALDRYVGHMVTILAEGDDERREYTGALAVSAVLSYQVILCLDDGACAIVHQPAHVRSEDGATAVTGEHQRVVVDERPDQPRSETWVLRPARILVRPHGA